MHIAQFAMETWGRATDPLLPHSKRRRPTYLRWLKVMAENTSGTWVQSVVRFGAENYPAHGIKDMPMWGPAFASLSGGMQSEQGEQVTMRINNLSHYIETLQVK